jgi:hypothetical protein
MFSFTGMDCYNYSQTLIGWAANSNTPNTLTLGATGLQYGTNAVSARDLLINTKGWTISGDAASGTDCSSTASLEEYDNRIELYPNPASNQLTIKTSLPNSGMITATSGAILTTLYLNGETTIDVSTYAPGVYFIRTTEGQTVKFIKE